MTAAKLKPVDVVVVGTGVAGSILCKELAETGLKVVGLERGRMIDPQHDFKAPYTHDELKFDRHSDIFQNLSRETITFRNAMSETALPMREMGSFKPGECVGGTAAQLIATNGPRARGLASWIARATSSLPVPVSPVMSTLAALGATRTMSSCTFLSGWLSPTNPAVVCIVSLDRSTATSRRSR